MADPGRLLRLADDMAGRAAEDEGFAALAVLAAHAVLESLVNQLGREEIQGFDERARFLPSPADRPKAVLTLKGLRNVGRDHAAHPYSWMRPPSTSRRRSVLVRASRCTALGLGTGAAKTRPRCGRSSQ